MCISVAQWVTPAFFDMISFSCVRVHKDVGRGCLALDEFAFLSKFLSKTSFQITKTWPTKKPHHTTSQITSELSFA